MIRPVEKKKRKGESASIKTEPHPWVTETGPEASVTGVIMVDISSSYVQCQWSESASKTVTRPHIQWNSSVVVFFADQAQSFCARFSSRCDVL